MRIKKIILSTIGLLGGFAVYKGIVNKEPSKYSLAWINNLSNNQWEEEREIVRQQYCDPNLSIAIRENFKRILDLFDKVKSDRDWAGRIPRGPAYHREHGRGLYKED